ncbi:MAG: adenylosuccinate synthase [Candidatus Bipolaricaulota bacterium]|nr:adenylosuccinate synthase [Candidatus Bipolaricaulota bacterium]
MNTLTIIGSQWGDEGKGKIADMLSEDADWVVRYNGGPNAGHTVVDDTGEFKFHHLPSASLHEDCRVLLGPGMVINPIGLVEELDQLQEKRAIEPDIFLGARAHVITPYHPVVEVLEKAKEEVGTTGRGIGPTYEDKAARSGFRINDLFRSDFEDRFRDRLEKLKERWDDPSDLDRIEEDRFFDVVDRLRDMVSEAKIVNSSPVLNKAIDEGKSVIFEGAQGTLLDIDFGTYPYVTSSNPTVGGIGTGAGVSPTRVERRIGVVKAYTTRVGKGPMPTEDEGDLGERLRDNGDEYGATTGRPRRCGPLDLVGLKFALDLNDMTEIALTKLDVLSGFDEIKVASHYMKNGEKITEFPSTAEELSECEPSYITFEGWDEDISHASSLEDLPSEAQGYVDFLEKELDVPISIVSIGKKRSQTIMVD